MHALPLPQCQIDPPKSAGIGNRGLGKSLCHPWDDRPLRLAGFDIGAVACGLNPKTNPQHCTSWTGCTVLQPTDTDDTGSQPYAQTSGIGDADGREARSHPAEPP